VAARLTTIMTRIKNLDTTSIRGQRKVATGIATPLGKVLLQGFDFNAHAGLTSIFHPPIAVDTVTGVVTVDSFVPMEQILAPEGATHFSMQSACVRLDFTTGKYETAYSTVFNNPLDMTATSVTLTPSVVSTLPAIGFFLVLVEFFQEINGVQYALKNGGYNALHILEVD